MADDDTKMAADSKVVQVPLSVALSIASIAFAAGSAVLSLHATTQAQVEMGRRLEEHVAAPGHAVEIQRLDQLERHLGESDAEIRGVGSELRAIGVQIENVKANIVGLCQATRGATCVR